MDLFKLDMRRVNTERPVISCLRQPLCAQCWCAGRHWSGVVSGRPGTLKHQRQVRAMLDSCGVRGEDDVSDDDMFMSSAFRMKRTTQVCVLLGR